jgi:hypothetical protein
VVMKYLFLLGVILIGFLPASAQKAKLPADLVIKMTRGGTENFSRYYTYTIGPDGRVTYNDSIGFSDLPTGAINSDLFGNKKPPKLPKQPKLADRLTDKQLLALMREFEASGFFQMRDDSESGDPLLEQQPCLDYPQSKILSITASGKTKSVSFFLGCTYIDESPLKAFLALYDKVSEMLSKVKATKVIPPPRINDCITC